MLVSDLSNKQLDYYAAIANGMKEQRVRYPNGSWVLGWDGTLPQTTWEPSTNWEFGGPLIEKHNIGVVKMSDDQWCAFIHPERRVYSSKPLKAAMQVLIVEKCGNEVE